MKKKLNFKVAITSDDHLESIKEAAFSAGCEWFPVTTPPTHILCVDSSIYSASQEDFEHSSLPLIHAFGQIDQLARMALGFKDTRGFGVFKVDDPIYLIDLLNSPCVSEGFYSECYEEPTYYNLVYPRNSEGFFAAVDKAKQLLEVAKIPF